MIYLDHAATSFPKPPEVVQAVREWMTDIGVNPGRAAYPAAARGAQVIFEAREALAELLGVSDSRRLAFTHNATHALNIALFGTLRAGDHVLCSSLEHNAVMRPLRQLEGARGVVVEPVAVLPDGRMDPAAFGRAVRAETRLCVVNHASNVVGSIAPLEGIRQAIGEVALLVDAAQTAGALPIDVEAAGIDMLAVTGHKALLGPAGTGALYVRPGLELPQPLICGGTGSSSDSERQPDFMPDRFEGGTPNAPGIAGLGAACRWLLRKTVAAVRVRELELTRRLLAGLREIDGLQVHGPADAESRTATVSVTIEGTTPSELAWNLARRWDIAVRAGLHCAPLAHRSLGTLPMGTLRIACGGSTSTGDVDAVVRALGVLAREGRSG